MGLMKLVQKHCYTVYTYKLFTIIILPLAIPRHRWVDDIEMDLAETGWGGVGWIGLAQDRDKCRALVNAVMKLLVP
jgi:hypothetical protein